MSKVFKRSGSSKFYGQLRTACGKRKQIPLSENKGTSQKLLARLQGEQDNLKALGLDDRSKRRTEPLKAHISAYQEHLTSKGSSPRHIRQVIGEIQRVSNSLKAHRISDLSSDKIQSLLERWRDVGIPKANLRHKPKPLSRESSNHYTRSLRAFSRFLWHSEVTDTDILRGLRILNSRPDRRHVRRALSDTEISRLIRETETRGETIIGRGWTMTGEDRAMLYRVAVFTGLRASELRSLMPESVDLDLGIIRLAAASAKNRSDAVIPIHHSLLEALKPWIADRPKGQPLWPGRWHTMGASMIRRDLALVDIPYRDSQGRIYDFHAMRSQFITGLARAGVHPATAQRLARHSSVELTLGVYTKLGDDTLREALADVPGLE